MKKDAASLLLSEKLDMMTMSPDVKDVLRATLSTVGAYRQAMGEPHYDAVAGAIVEGKSSEHIDLTWRGTLGVLGKMFLEFFEARC